VQLRSGEEGGVVQRDDGGNPAGQRHRVVRAVQHLGPHPAGQPGQRGLLPGQPPGPGGDLFCSGQHVRVRGQPSVELGVARLAQHRRSRTVGLQRGNQAIHVPPDTTTIGRDCRRVDEHSGLGHAGSLRRHCE
jgi:hypothetical protein